MSKYLRWGVRQCYLLLCWPSRFGREAAGTEGGAARMTRKHRLLYALKILPWVALLTVIANVIAGLVTHLFWDYSDWDLGSACGGVLCGVMLGATFGIAFACVFGITFGIAFGSIFSIASGVFAGVLLGSGIEEYYVAVGVGAMIGGMTGAAASTATNAAWGGEGGVMRSVWRGLVGSVAGWVAIFIWVILLVKFDSDSPLIYASAIGLLGWAIGLATGVSGNAARGCVGALVLGITLGVGVVITRGVIGQGESEEWVRYGFAFGVPLSVAFCVAYFRLLTYPVQAMLSWLALAKARRHPERAFHYWRRCPVAWNEVIYLPLPGAGKLLALATRRNREEGFRLVAFVDAERPLQRRVALEALAEIALEDLEARTASDLASAPERMAWTADAPLALPEGFAAALLRFDRIARQAGQSLTVASAFRKADALRRAIEELDSLQKTLVASADRFSPRLLQVANRWREILEGEQARLKQLAAARRETPNPFVFGNPVDERNASVFAGRQQVVRQIEESLLGARQSPALLLHGPRRMGKTSILKQLPRLLGPDFAPALLDCQNPAVGGSEATTASLLRYLSAALSEGLLRRRLDVKPLPAEALAREPFAVFDAWLARVEQAMPPAMRALLCVDEYEKLQRAIDAGWGGDFLDALRHTLQHRPRFVLLFTGAHTFAELGPAWTDRFISARRVRLSFLTPEEVRPLLTKPVAEFDLTYAPGAVDAIVEATHCQPFLTQAVAFDLLEYLNEQQRKEASREDVETAVARALESGGEYFANVWSDAQTEGQAILREIALGTPAAGAGANGRAAGGLKAEALKLETGGNPPALTPTKAMKWLRDHDVLDENCRFAVPMMERWVRETQAA